MYEVESSSTMEDDDDLSEWNTCQISLTPHINHNTEEYNLKALFVYSAILS